MGKTNIALGVLVVFLFINGFQLEAQETGEDKKAFKPSGKVWGYVFGDYYYKVHADSLKRGNTQYSNMSKDKNAFDFRRVYLGYDFNISEKFSTQVLLSYEPGTTLADGATRSFFLKAANLRWKNIFPQTDFVIGQTSTPSFSMTSEKVWGYRSVEKTITDMRKISGSNDVGIALQGTFDKNGNFGYNIMLGNGTAQKIPTTIFKRIYGDIYAKFIDNRLIIDLYGDYYRSQLTPYHKSLYTAKVFLGYQSDIISAGVEALIQPMENSAIYFETDTLKMDTVGTTSLGYSVFVRGRIIKDRLSYFARFDSWDPDMGFGSARTYYNGSMPNTEMFITAGLDITPHKNVHIIPNVWYNSYNNRSANVNGVTKNDFDLAARLTFYYVFKE